MLQDLPHPLSIADINRANAWSKGTMLGLT
jgi:hypothetical protein